MTVPRYLLDLTRTLCYLRAFLFIGRCHMYREQLSQGVHRVMHLAAALVTVIARGRPLSQLDCIVRPITALGCPCRPCATRITGRRSLTVFSKQPACNQRWVCLYTSSQGAKSLGSIRQGAPARAIQRSASNMSQFVFALWRGDVHQGQIRCREASFFVGHIARIPFTVCSFHSARIPGLSQSS